MHRDEVSTITQDMVDAMIQMYDRSSTFGKSILQSIPSIKGKSVDFAIVDDWVPSYQATQSAAPTATYPLTGKINGIGWLRLHRPKLGDIRYDLSRIYSDPIVLLHEYKADLNKVNTRVKQIEADLLEAAGIVTIEEYKKACIHLAIGEMKLKYGFDASFPPPIIRPKPTIDQMVAAIKPEKPREEPKPKIEDRSPPWRSSGSIRSLRSSRRNEKR